MKTRLLFLLSAGVAALSLASCSKHNVEVVDDGQLRLSTANVISGTKAGQDLQSTQFAKDEKVGIFLVEDSGSGAVTSGTNVTVYNSGKALEYTADGNGNLSNTQYWPTNGNGLYIYGVYPMAAATTAGSYSASGVSFEVKADQSKDDDYKASDLMTGVPSGNPVTRTTEKVALTFTHLLSKISITLNPGDGFDSGLSGVKVSILGTQPSTTFSVGSKVVATASGDAAPVIAGTGLSCGSSDTIPCAAIIVPQSIANNTEFIKVEVGGGSYIYKLEKQTTFEGQKEYKYEITVKKTGLEVTTSIGAWTAVGPTTGDAILQ